MSSLKWFSGITWGTPVREIGWTWIVLAAMSVTTVVLIVRMVKIWRE